MATSITVLAADAGKLLLRLAVGALVLLHGMGKITGGAAFVVGLVEKAGLPGVLGYAVYAGEVLAPVLMILGLWTRVAGLIVAANMAVAVLLVHMDDLARLTQGGGWALELQAMFFFGALSVALIGPGRYAIMRS